MKITFPHLGPSYLALETLLSALGHQPITPPLSSKHTLERGGRHSPEQACLPFKIILGNMLEGLERGAEAVVMLGGTGPCRLGYYGEIQRILLEKQGFEGEFFALEAPALSRAGSLQSWRRLLGGAAGLTKLPGGLALTWAKLKAAEELEGAALWARPREEQAGSVPRLLRQRLAALRPLTSARQVARSAAEGGAALRALGAARPERPLPQIAVLGEIYTLLEPFSNFQLEQRLGDLGVQVQRTVSLTQWIRDHLLKRAVGISHVKPLALSAEGYLRGFIGGHGLESVARSVDLAQSGLDGIIHILPLSCMPEVVAQGILPKVGAERGIPIMSLVVDEHSAEVGFQTRLEAFVDLVERRMALNGRK